ncbi:(3R)-3-hydroxyacyl-CoA dehydrogenase [Parasteatoda tepidariorum]|nr:estradiol 17-beta-dehydrogenase 8 [Parasteatoda tepidariorum]
MASSLLLAGRVAIITGGGGGIGRTVSKLFAKEGATVIATDNNESALKETIQMMPDADKHFSHVIDVSQSESVASFVQKISKECPTPDVLVNCAGITRDCLMVKMTETMFDDVIKVNLKGTYLMTQAVTKLMMEKQVQSGSVVNISSVSAKGNLGQCNYSASKAGVEGFTKSAAIELARHNIRCNAVVPGFINTQMLSTIPDKVMEKVVKSIPLQRLGEPEEIAEVCAFLASKRSSYVTGSIIQVSGGLML